MMSENKILWLGLLVGLVLTAGLMFVLYQQASPLTASQQAVDNAAKRSVITPETPEVSQSVEPEKPLPVRKKQSDEIGEVMADLKTGAVGSQEGNNSVAVPDVGLPEELDLSAEQLEELSEAERQQYDVMLKSYSEVRARVLRLHQEREQLRQRMDAMFEQNETIERKLGEIQEAVGQHQKAGTATR